MSVFTFFEEKTRLLLALAAGAGFWLVGQTQGLGADGAAGKAFADYLKNIGYEAVPARRTDKNELLLEARIGEQKQMLLLDTGWGRTSLNERAARGLKKLGELGGSMEDGRFGVLTDPSLVIMEKLALGRAQFMNQPARLQTLEAEYINTPYNGVLGCDFFSRNFCVVDCLSGTLFVRGAKPSEDLAGKMTETFHRSGFTEVPTDPTPYLVITVQVNGHSVRLLADTGSHTTLLDQKQSKPFGLLTYKQKDTESIIPQDMTAKAVGMGKIGTHEYYVATIKDFELGNRKMNNLHVGVCNLDAWAKPEGRDFIGIIGQDLLESLGGVLDFGNGKVWLRVTKKS